MTRESLIALVLLAGCADPPASVGSMEIDTRAERSERDVDVYLATQIEIAASTPILRRALERRGMEADVDAVRDRVRVERRGESSILDVRVSVAGDPEEAAELCNAILEAYVHDRIDRLRATAPPEDVEAIVDVGARLLEPCRMPATR